MLLESIRQVIQKNHLIPHHSHVVVAVSGGADSLTLLHILHLLRARLGFSLYAASFDHQLRGEESQNDVRFVQAICQQWGIPIIVGQGDVAAMAHEQHLGIETAARRARYAFLADVAALVGASRIATAHHADDQAETVLMHLTRGAGMHGLRGMGLELLLPGYSHLTLIRPMLLATRAEIEAYCRENELAPRHDSTNQDPNILRNAVRLHILPQLEKLNPNIRQALTQWADVATFESDYLDTQLQIIATSQGVQVRSHQVFINRADFVALHPALQRRLIIWGVHQVGRPDDVSYQHVVAAVQLALHGQQGAVALFKDAVCLRVDYQMLVIERQNTDVASNFPLLPAGIEIQVAIPGMTRWDDWALAASLMPPGDAMLSIPLGSQVILRTRRAGDHFAPLGMGGHTQKLNRWMINRKISRSLRERIPLLVVNGQIAAVMVDAQWTIDEKFALKSDSQHVVYFRFPQNL